MTWHLLDRTFQRAPRRFSTAASAGLALLDLAVNAWWVKVVPGAAKILVPQGKPLRQWGLFVRYADGLATIDCVADCLASHRTRALFTLLEWSGTRTWIDTPAEHLHIIKVAGRVRKENL